MSQVVDHFPISFCYHVLMKWPTSITLNQTRVLPWNVFEALAVVVLLLRGVGRLSNQSTSAWRLLTRRSAQRSGHPCFVSRCCCCRGGRWSGRRERIRDLRTFDVWTDARIGGVVVLLVDVDLYFLFLEYDKKEFKMLFGSKRIISVSYTHLTLPTTPYV